MLEGHFGYINPRFSTENSGQTCRLQSQIALVVISAMLPQFSSIQFSSVAQSCLTLCIPMDCSMPVLLVHHQLPESTHTHVYWVGDAIHSTISSSVVPTSSRLQTFPASGSFKWIESVFHIRRPKYWNFSFSMSPSNECSGMIFFRMDWLDLLAVQGRVKGLSCLLVAQLS